MGTKKRVKEKNWMPEVDYGGVLKEIKLRKTNFPPG